MLPYERSIYIFSYKNKDFLQSLQKALLEINLSCLGIEDGNERDIRTRKLTFEEKNTQSFDFIGGVQLIDKDYRIIILEGLAGGSMDELAKKIPKANANTEMFKIQRNPKQTFSQRIYLDFNVDMKKIKLRKSINNLTYNPDIYLREKVPADIYDTIIKLRKIREKWEIKDIISSKN